MKRHAFESERPAVVTVADLPVGVSATAIPFGEKAVVLAQTPPDWFRPLLARIGQLGQLAKGWDSYGAEPVDPHCAATAVKFLLRILDGNSPQPSVTPTVRGGIQLEWHHGGADLEIEVEAPGRLGVLFADTRAGEEVELTLTDDLRPLVPLLERVLS